MQSVLSGYLGLPSNAEVVASAVDYVKKLDDSRLYILDPVIGDDGKVFVKKGNVLLYEIFFSRGQILLYQT